VPSTQPTASQERVERVLGSREYLPPTPEVIVRLWQIIDDPDTTVDDLAEIVEGDPGVTSGLLRVVNSASFGLNRHISSVREAIVYLGFGELKNLSIAIVVRTGILLRRPSMQTMDRSLLWRHCVGSGIVARYFAKATRKEKPDTAFVAGLLHDVGWMILDLALPREVLEVLNEAKVKKSHTEPCEYRRWGFTHSDVGAWLLKKWGLPVDVWEPVLYHHRSQRASQNPRLAAYVHIADIFATQAMPYLPQLPPPDDPPESVWKAAELNPQLRVSALQNLQAELNKMTELLRVEPAAA
jgi:HD-like signal output (HDOD) protein